MSRFGKAAPAGAKKGRFAGVDPNAGNGKPLLPLGEHTLEVIETRHSALKSSSFFADLKMLESTNPAEAQIGATYQYLQMLTDSYGYGDAAMTRFIIAAGDLDDAAVEEMIAEAQEEQSLIDACCGAETRYGANPLAGRKVKVIVTQGKATKDGKGWFRDCQWEAVEQ